MTNILYKQPPDKYHTLKIPLKNLLKNPSSSLITLSSAIHRTNQLTTLVLLFLRAYLLHQYHQKQSLYIITNDVIKMAFKVFLKKATAGTKPVGSNLKIFNQFNQFHQQVFSTIINNEPIDGLHLAQILQSEATQILTNIENNIKLHFVDYLKRFINAYFKIYYAAQLSQLKGKSLILFKKTLSQELYQLKQDLLNGTTHSNPKYHHWLDQYRHQVIPSQLKSSKIDGSAKIKIQYIPCQFQFSDLQTNPQKYLKYMIFMNLELEKLGAKQFQFFPLRTQLIPKHIAIDTATLIRLYVTENQKKYLNDIEGSKSAIWNLFFKMDHRIFKNKKYVFDYRIMTDGFSVSLQMINQNFIDQEKKKKKKLKKARQQARETNQNLTREEIDYQRGIKIANQKIIMKNRKDDFQKLSQIEKQNIIDSRNVIDNVTYQPSEYINDLPQSKLLELKTENLIYIDPGKKTLLMMMNNYGQYMRYTNRQRIKETKRLKYQQLLHNYREKQGILNIENCFHLNSKTCRFEKFNEYIKNKLELNRELSSLYTPQIFRQYRWYSYINRKRSEDNLLNHIEKTYGKDAKIVIGNWQNGNYQLKNMMPTPGISLLRKLNERFEVFLIDEFRTSCLHHKTEQKCENLYLPDRNGQLRKIHAVLTYQMENGRNGCINRDKNAVLNMRKIVRCYLEGLPRPLRYQRSYDITKIGKKETQPLTHFKVKLKLKGNCQMVSSSCV